jgi:uncharacterized repeat protein (TIGR03803 family)
VSRQAVTESVLYSFPGKPQGWDPNAGLIIGRSGELYGTTLIGGSCHSSYYGCGTVFKLTPAGTGYAEAVIHDFGGEPDGAAPSAPLAVDSRGRLYGTTYSGGNGFGMGTVFMLKPPGSGYSETVIHRFSGHPGDRSTPFSGVAVDEAGNVYGTASSGGAYSRGVAYKLGLRHGVYSETILYNFGANHDSDPKSQVVIGPHGAIYGTTARTVFELSPTHSGYAERTLYRLRHSVDGADLTGTLLAGKNGVWYGTAQHGGPTRCGTVFALSPSGSTYAFKLLHVFRCHHDFAKGAFPQAGVIADEHGALYGTTYNGGNRGCSLGGCGIVYKLVRSGSHYVESVLWSFLPANDGNEPFEGLVADASGAIYGTTGFGGRAGVRGGVFGTVFRITR